MYRLVVHKDDLTHRQPLGELTLGEALLAMRQAGQTVLVAVDRGLAKCAWVGVSPWYPCLPLLRRRKRTTLLPWGSRQGRLQEWPRYAGEGVEIAEAALGQDAQVVTAGCLAHLPGAPESLCLACHPADCARAVASYAQCPAVAQPKRALKSHLVRRK